MCAMQLEDRVSEDAVVDADLEESLQQIRSLVNPWTLIEQQVKSSYLTYTGQVDELGPNLVLFPSGRTFWKSLTMACLLV